MRTRLRGMWRKGSMSEALGRKPAEHGPVGPCHENGPCHVEAWLDVVCKLVRLPREETEGIRAELGEHLRERVRDLMVEGEPEEAATRRAISELGDAAALADRFRRAEHAPRRRMLMNIAMLGMAAGVAVAGAVGLNKLSGTGGGVQSPPQVRYASADVGEKTISLAENATLEKYVQELGRVTGHGTHVYWDALKGIDLEKDTRIEVPLSGVTIEAAMMLVNERLCNGKPSNGGDRLACRMTGETLEVSTLKHFDTREITLVAYDVGAALGSASTPGGPSDRTEQLSNLIISVIEPEQWKQNGGEMAELYVVREKMFVKAPARFQPRVQWILTQLGSDKSASAAVEQSEKTSFTASGSRVTMARGESSVTATRIEVDPAKDTIEAIGNGVEVSAAVRATQKDPGLVYLSGSVPRPGVYQLPENGLTVRRLLVAGGVSTANVREVIVSSSGNGHSTVMHRLTGDELRTESGKDPILAKGEAIEVK